MLVPACAAPAFLAGRPGLNRVPRRYLAARCRADLFSSRRTLLQLRITGPVEASGNIGEPIRVPIQVTRKPDRPWPARTFRLGLLFPAAVDVLRDDLETPVIPAARAMEVEFEFRGGERGEFIAGPAYLGRTSALGLLAIAPDGAADYSRSRFNSPSR